MEAEGISGAAVVVASEGQVSTGAEGEAVILNLEQGVYYGLDGVGTRIWELLQEPTTVDEIAELIATEYGVERERSEEDLKALLAELAAAGLVEIGAAPVDRPERRSR